MIRLPLITPLLLFLLTICGTSQLFSQDTHEVRKGETLFSISQEYDVEVESIRKANELGNADIEPGQELTIPATDGQNGVDTIEHEVQEGETLYSISKEYRADIDKVLQLNPEAKKEIEIGQVLRIPVGTDPPDEEKKGRFPFDSTKAGYHYHRIEKGETLFSLYERYGASIDSIRSSNPHLEKEPEVGQLLRIPKGKVSGSEEKDQLALPDSLSRDGYRVHRAERGETLYSIARRNGITLEHLMQENPHISGELLEGQAVRIPSDEGERTPRSHEDTLLLHEVKEGESVRSIATMYGTDPALIVIANDLFYSKIEEGDLLLIPIPPRTPATPPSDTEMKESYRVGLILPLYLKENDSILSDPEEYEEKPELYGASSYALEFYEGFRMAADSVALHQGASFDIEVISTRKGTEKLSSKLEEAEFRDLDLIVGPFYRSNLGTVVETMKGSGVHHVCPVRHSNKILLDHPNISKAIPSSSTLIKRSAEHVVQEHGHQNVLLLDNEKPDDDERLQLFRDRFDRLIPNIDSAFRDSIPTVTLSKKANGDLKDELKEDSLNILVAPGREKAFASRLMNRIASLNQDLGEEKSYPIRIYASEEWKNFQTVDIKYKERFGLHIVTGQHIQHDSLPAERFYKDYRERNHTDPGEYGFLGFDVGSFYLNGLAQFGTGFRKRFDRIEAPTLHLGFELFRTGVSSGYENQHAHIIRYTKEHRIERMKVR